MAKGAKKVPSGGSNLGQPSPAAQAPMSKGSKKGPDPIKIPKVGKGKLP